jgi:hypothetical protein
MSGRTSPVPPSSVPGGAGTLSLKVQAARRDAKRMPTALLCRRRCVEGGSCPEVLHGRVNSTRLDPPTHKIGSAHSGFAHRPTAEKRVRPGLRNGLLRVASQGVIRASPETCLPAYTARSLGQRTDHIIPIVPGTSFAPGVRRPVVMAGLHDLRHESVLALICKVWPDLPSGSDFGAASPTTEERAW